MEEQMAGSTSSSAEDKDKEKQAQQAQQQREQQAQQTSEQAVAANFQAATQPAPNETPTPGQVNPIRGPGEPLVPGQNVAAYGSTFDRAVDPNAQRVGPMAQSQTIAPDAANPEYVLVRKEAEAGEPQQRLDQFAKGTKPMYVVNGVVLDPNGNIVEGYHYDAQKGAIVEG
jgi:ATPase subunit of ABC transporter with duplicated ATPase domains